MPSVTAIVLATILSGRAGLVSFQRVPVPAEVPAHLTSAIAQDRQGFLWFGTQRGLVRYDGYEYRVFRSTPNDPTTLGGSYVRALLVAADGRLWVGTFSGGLSVFDPATETFTRHPQYNRVEGLAEDRTGRIWIATNAGLDRLDAKTRRVEHFLGNERVRGLLVARDGTVWAGTREGLLRFDGRAFQRVTPELAGQLVVRLFEDRRGRIWIGTEEHGAAVFDGRLTRLAPGTDGLSHYWVYGFAEGAPGEIWIATFGGGIDVVDDRSLQVVDRLRHDATLGDTIGADRVGAVFRDRMGTIWVGTWGEGIARHDPRTRAFRTLRFSPNRPEGLTHPAAVRAMEMRDGTIWVGTNGNGIDILDAALRRVGGHRTDVLGDGAVTCLAQSVDGTIWIATLNGMLHRMQNGAIAHLPLAKLPGGPIRTIAFGADGTVWAGAAEGMVQVEPRTLATRVHRQLRGAAEAIVVAPDGTLWVGSDNGLYSFDPRSATATRVAAGWVPDLMLARDGRLWVGTANGAAVMEKGRLRPITNTPAEALLEDDHGAVWIGPRLRIANGRQREFGANDGCTYRSFFIASRARTRDGRLLFGSPEGLLVVHPQLIAEGTAAPPIVATALRVEGKPRAGAAVLSSLTLTPAERSFSLDFAALDFAQRQNYRYRLDGLDRDWTMVGPSQHSLTLSRLPPGRYVLRVGVTGGEGELRLPVIVQPALYQTRWFRALLIVLGAALLYALYRLRVRQLHARERRLERLVAARTSELKTAYAKIEEASLTDPLTGLRNRRFLEQNIAADLELASRGHGDLIVLLTDLDHFKSVNDTHGHAAGDAVLVALAALLRDTFRASDHVVRWGGEEFLIVIRFIDRLHAGDLAEKLRAAVEAHRFVLPGGTVLRRTCSIGYAAWPHEGLPFHRVIDLADEALYEAKRGGRNAAVGVTRSRASSQRR